MKTLYILDAVSFLFRSYFAIGPMTNRCGQSTQALYGFIRSVQKIIRDFSPKHLVAVFDGPNNKRARVEIYKEYKSHRKGMPEDLFSQLELTHKYCEYVGIPYLSEEGVEADDLIGAIAKLGEEKGMKVFICSNDKDLCQLITDRIFLLNIHKNNLLVDRQKVEELYGIRPEQVVDYLALMGDKSDNIPGIPGFGPKTAAALLQKYGSLERILSNLQTMHNQKWAEKIRTHEEDARISQRLARLIPHSSFPHDEDFYEIKSSNLDNLCAFYREMDFNSLLRELEQQENESTPSSTTEDRVDYQIVDTLDQLKTLITTLEKASMVGIDTETHILDPMEASLIGIGFCFEPGRAWYIPTNGKLGLDLVVKHIKPLLENPAILFYGHNIKYDIHILKNHNIDLKSIGYDTMVASYLLTPQSHLHGLDHLALKYFNKVNVSIKELMQVDKTQRSPSEIPIEALGNYCCEDVDYTCRLKELFERKVKEANLSHMLHEVELPLIPVLVAMERFGVYLDQGRLRSMSMILRDKLKIVEEEIYALSGRVFNIRSPKQLQAVLFDEMKISPGKQKKSTRADILEKLQYTHPIVERILEFRKLEKLRSTYVEKLPLQICKKSGRVHCSFMQAVTATGRLSCKNPNLQNIPLHSKWGEEIRRAFRPKNPDWCYLSADYSQIELRLLAHMSGDPNLISAFQLGEDIHTATAASVFNVPAEEVTKKMRTQAKAVIFGILYGQQPFGLSEGLGVRFQVAAEFIQKYFDQHPKVKECLEECKESVRKKGFASTLFGRKRPIPEIHSPNGQIRTAAERLAVNTPFQGTQADIIKLAMIKLHKEIDTKAHMILQIHDELLFELPKENVEWTKKTVKGIMENVASLSIPLEVNISVGKNWGEC